MVYIGIKPKQIALEVFIQYTSQYNCIKSSSYLLPSNYISKIKGHIHKIREHRTKTEVGKNFFFFYKTIEEWNALPSKIVCAGNDVFLC